MKVRVGELARASGVSVRSLRYYEDQGLLSSERTVGGHRTYQVDAVDRVALIQCLYAAGLPSASVVLLLRCEDSGVVSEDMIDEVRRQQARIGDQLSRLSEASDRLDALLDVMQESRDA